MGQVRAGNIRNISLLLKGGTYKKYFRDYVNRNLKNIADLNGYPHQSTFKELVKYHVDVTSPLRRLPMMNGYIVISPSQKIPYSTENFLRLLSKTTLKGMRVLFDVHLGRDGLLTVASPSYHYNPFIFYNNNGNVDIVTFRYSEYRSHTNLTVVSFDNNILFSDEVDNFSKFFDTNSTFPVALESNGYRISSDGTYFLSGHVSEDKINGLVTFGGLDENGMIKTTNGNLFYTTCSRKDSTIDFYIVSRNCRGYEKYISVDIR